MRKFDELINIVAHLRSENGCPWDREQNHVSLKSACIEETAEVICGINILDKTGSGDNLKEELGDLLLQVVMHAQIAEEEGLFTISDVIDGIKSKMVRRHPHVFGGAADKGSVEVPMNWEEIKAQEKAGKSGADVEPIFLPAAFEEAKDLIDIARHRKGFDKAEIRKARQGEYKLEIFVPETHLQTIRKALQESGAGQAGNYDSCLAYSHVTGSWRPLSGAHPYIGEEGKTSDEPEIKVEVNVRGDKLEEALKTVIAVHPYEEPLINVIPLISVQ